MARVFILAVVFALMQPVRTGAQAPAAELYPIVFVHGFCSNADTWSVIRALMPAGGVVTLGWTPAAAGGVPATYVLRGTYRNPQGVVTPFDLPVGAATTIVVPPNLPGAFPVRVHAQNAAGESPASNELAFTIPPS